MGDFPVESVCLGSRVVVMPEDGFTVAPPSPSVGAVGKTCNCMVAGFVSEVALVAISGSIEVTIS